MMFLMSQKFFKKHAEKLVAPRNYIIIDGENMGVSIHSEEDQFSHKYRKSIVSGGWSPEGDLYKMIKRMKEGETVNEKKFKRELDDYLHSKDFVGSVCMAAVGLVANNGEEDINVFVVIPNIVYKYLSDAIIERAKEIINDGGETKVKFIFPQSIIKKKGKDVLNMQLGNKKLKAIAKGIERAEKKYKLRKGK